MPKNIRLIVSNEHNIEEEAKNTDAVIGALLIPAAKAPKLMTEEMIKKMKPNSVIVDVAIDQGGCMATSKPTSHGEPVYKVMHYTTVLPIYPEPLPELLTFALTNTILLCGLKFQQRAYKSNKGKYDSR